MSKGIIHLQQTFIMNNAGEKRGQKSKKTLVYWTLLDNGAWQLPCATDRGLCYVGSLMHHLGISRMGEKAYLQL